MLRVQHLQQRTPPWALQQVVVVAAVVVGVAVVVAAPAFLCLSNHPLRPRKRREEEEPRVKAFAVVAAVGVVRVVVDGVGAVVGTKLLPLRPEFRPS